MGGVIVGIVVNIYINIYINIKIFSWSYDKTLDGKIIFERKHTCPTHASQKVMGIYL